MERVTAITTLHDKIVVLRQEAASLMGTVKHIQNGNGKLDRGLRTPEEAYRRPILEALVEMGGSGKCADVLELVEKKMKGILKDVDYELMPSGGMLRWRNAAMWCRNTLANIDGLMKKNSPRGIWEVDDAGRRFLEQ